ncbi:MAG: hypothetical protein U0169_22805 [Polyangiaceae bacterium]
MVVHGTEVFFVDADVESNGAPSDACLVESIDVATGRRRRLGEGLDLASVSSLRVCGEHVTVAANARGGGTDVLVLDRSESPSTPRRIRSARGTFEAFVACDATHAYLAHDDGTLEALRLDGIPRSGA